MDLARPARTVVPALAADVLVVLAGTTRPLAAREVHRLVQDASWGGVRNVLTQLAESGLADLAEVGNATLYTLNREHVAADAVLALVDLRGRLFARMRTALLDWSCPPTSALVFGSAARGDGDLDSDIDVLLVRPRGIRKDDPRWSADVTALGTAIRMWSGNAASILDLSAGDLRSFIHRNSPVAEELRRDQVLLVGEALVVSGGSR